jgi:hypothetical protein
MVKSRKKPGNPAWAPRATKLGRKYGNPADVRTGRLVQRIHPHLESVIEQRAREYGLTKSQLVEKILIDHMNAVEGAQLDRIGRWVDDLNWQDFRHMYRRDQLAISPIALEIGKQVQAEAEAEAGKLLPLVPGVTMKLKK